MSINGIAEQGAGLADFAGRTMADLHRGAGGDPGTSLVVARAAQALWTRIDAGALSLDLNELAAQLAMSADALRDVLGSSPVIGAAGGPDDINNNANTGPVRPLVLQQNRLFTARHWQAEVQIASTLIQLAAQQSATRISDGMIGRYLRTNNPDALQASALRIGVSGQLLVLSGGPGTGKTTTLGALVRALQALEPGSRIAVAAPTGKAATRLAEAIGEPADANNREERANEAGALQPSTLHRLLGYQPDGNFQHGPGRPLPYDVVIVDECSMVDAMLAARLLTALAPGARLILSGDQDQLSSVEPGAFFGAVCRATHTGLRASTVVLQTNYRQHDAPEIVDWANAVRQDKLAGELPSTGQQVFLQDCQPGQAPAEVIASARNLFKPLVVQAASAGIDGAADLLEAFGQFRVLASLRAGPAGVDALNQAIAQGLRAQTSTNQEWFAGRLIIITRNQPGAGLFNGDIGLVIHLPHGQPGVVFTSGGHTRVLSVLQLPAYADAFALTIHQSQGSAFDEVLLLPAPAEHPLATRAALYTGITRARRRLRVFASVDDLRWAAGQSVNPEQTLLERLQQDSMQAG